MAEPHTADQGQDEMAQYPPAGVVLHTALADWYALLAFLFQVPTPDTMESMQETSIAADFSAIVQEAGQESEQTAEIAAGLDALHEHLAETEGALSEVRIEYTRLFTHPKKPVIWPYEGVFHDVERVAAGKKSTEARLFVNPAAGDCERKYKAAGFHVTGMRVPADCISTELEFAGLLHEKMAAALIEGDAGEEAFAAASESLEGFKEDHLAVWVPRFFERVEQESEHEFFRLAARMGSLLMEAEHIVAKPA